MKINYDGRKFRSVSNSASGEVDADTVFHYQQRGDVVTAKYAGGQIASGHLIARCDEDGRLEMTYAHINTNGQLMEGECSSTPEILEDGRIRLHEKWRWTRGAEGAGESVIEEF
jgi:hypothetical protein